MKYKHVKTGKTYELVLERVAQRSRISSEAQHVDNAWIESTLEVVPVFREPDGTYLALVRLAEPSKPFVMYVADVRNKGDARPRAWLRPSDEFHDGRFLKVID